MLSIWDRRLNQSLKDYKFKLIRDSILELPFEENTFDCITIAFGLRNISDKNKVLSEMYRVLKLGGRLVCLEISTIGFKNSEYKSLTFGITSIHYGIK